MKKYFLRISIALFLLVVLIGSFIGGDEQPQPESAAKDVTTSALPAAINGVNIADPAVLAREKPIIVTFAEPMVAESALQKDVAEADLPFTLVPPLPGKGRWLTPKSFAMAVENDFTPGTGYSLYFKEDLKSLDGRPARYVFSFRTKGVEVQAVQPGLYDAESGTLQLHFNFSDAVGKEALAEHLEVVDPSDGKVFDLDFERSPKLSSSHSALVPLGPSKRDLALTLRRDKPGDAHPLRLDSEFAVKLLLPGEGGEIQMAAAGDEDSPIHIQNPYDWENEQGERSLQVYLSEGLLDAWQKENIEVSPELPWRLGNYRYGATLYFDKGLQPGMRLSVRLKPGLTDREGRVLKEERVLQYKVPDYRPRVSFAEAGHMLSPLFSKRVAVNLVNVDQVNVSLRRQYDNNLPMMDFDPDQKTVDMMREMTVKEIRLTGLKKNEVQRRAIDLESLAGGRRGVFMLGVTALVEAHDQGSGMGYMEYQNEAERLVVLTDIGVTARVFPSGITVLATGISSARPLADAAVMVYSRSNQLIARGFTDGDGLFVHQRQQVWEDQLQPHIVVVRHGHGLDEDATFLPLTHDTWLAQDDPALRLYLESGFEAFVYTPRGVFRPGEEVRLKAFVRDKDQKAPSPFPVLFRVTGPRGAVAASASVELSEEGGADLAFTLPESAPTGHYRAMVEIPGNEEQPLGSCEFSVEDFVPPRLEVALKAEADSLQKGGELRALLGGRYLFGAPGAGLNYELGYLASEEVFSPEGYEGYSFGDPERVFHGLSNLDWQTGKLPESGEADLALTPPAEWDEATTVLGAKLVASVQEDGGRWVSRTVKIRYFPGPFLLGLKPEGENFAAGQALSVAVAALDPEGAKVESGPLRAEISLIQSNWHTVYRNNRYVQTFDERLVPKESVDLDVKDGQALLTFTPEEHGLYLVRVLAAGGEAVSSRRIAVMAGAGEPLAEGTGRMDKVELSFDKQDYLAGETARLTVKAPFAGTLLLGLERGAQLSARVLKLESPGAELEIPVTEGMTPNITVTASVIRPVRGEESEWYNHRAFGSATLLLSKKPHSLVVSQVLPPKALPGATLSLPFTVTDEQGAPVEGEFSVALVDEGILSLTGFATPSPADFFLGQRASAGQSHDAYDALLRPEARATPLLKPGGGMAMAAAAGYQGSLGTQPVFLSAFLPTVKTDANGQGEAVFEVPEYSGQGRVMIVGAAGSRFASGEGKIVFGRDLVLEASAPRVVAPGDEFEIFLRLFADAEADRALEDLAGISLSAEGLLTLDTMTLPPSAPAGGDERGKDNGPDAEKAPAGGEAAEEKPAEQGSGQSAVADGTGDADKSDKARSFSVRARAGQEPGLAVIRLEVAVPGREDLTFAKELQVAVRPPFARSGATVQALVRAGEKTELSLPGAWSGTGLESRFTLGASPARTLLPALDFLFDYPYGCLEQTVSRAWPHLALPGLTKALANDGGQSPDEKSGDGGAGLEANEAAALALYVKAVLALQRPGGGFASWPDRDWPDPWRSVYAIWFLNEVKDRVQLPKSALEAGRDYLNFILAAPEDFIRARGESLSVKAFAAMVLARDQAAPLGWMQHLDGLTEEMLPSGRIFLAGAMALKAGNAQALKELERNAEALRYERFAPEDGVPSPYFESNRTLESDLRNKALLLWLWAQVEPQSARCRELCLEITGELNARPCFTTQEAGLSALAVGSWLEKAGFAAGAYGAALSFDGKVLAEAASGQDLILEAGQLPPPGPEGLLPSLALSLTGEGSAWAVYSVRGLPLAPPPPAANGLSISRVWKKADGEIVDLADGVAQLAKGERITVELSVRSDAVQGDIVLSDLLPGGLEVENPRLAVTAAAQEDEEEGSERVKAYIDQREDRMLFFIDRLKGEARFVYSMRAVSRGSFMLPPLAASAMYDPAINAVTAAGTVLVE